MVFARVAQTAAERRFVSRAHSSVTVPFQGCPNGNWLLPPVCTSMAERLGSVWAEGRHS